MDQEVLKAVNVLNDGGIVIFPTDTAFGIGCRIDGEKAIKRLFEIRRRPKTLAAPILVDSVKMAQKYLQSISNNVEELMNKYWPGALTIVLPCKVEKVPSLVRGGGNTLGVRMPNHEATLSIIKNVGVPILGPSANFHEGKTPYSFKDLDPRLIEQVDYIVHGKTLVRQVSTVIDCSQKPWRILRQGAIGIPNEML